MGERRGMNKFLIGLIIGSLVGGIYVTYRITGQVSKNITCSKEKDWVQELAKKDMKEYMECKQAQSYEYMKHHREMVRNLIKQGKYDSKDSFWVENSDGGYELFYYSIGLYEFQEDGVLFGQKVIINATEVVFL